MSKIRSKNTKPEMLIRKALWEQGIRGYRLHWKKAPGKPDLAFPGRKIAIFINGCYWHRCPKCQLAMPKHNAEFWKKKFEGNIARDARNEKLLDEAGWKSITLWECEVKKKLGDCIHDIKMLIAQSS